MKEHKAELKYAVACTLCKAKLGYASKEVKYVACNECLKNGFNIIRVI